MPVATRNFSPAQVRSRADAGRCEIQIAGFRFCGGDEIGHGLEALRRRRHQHTRLNAEQHDRCKIAQAIVGQGLVQNDVRAQRRGVQKKRVAVGVGLRHLSSAKDAASARPVFDDERLAELLSDLVEHDAGDDVVGVSGGERAYHLHRACRPRLGECRGAGCDRGGARNGAAKCANRFHVVLPGYLPEGWLASGGLTRRHAGAPPGLRFAPSGLHNNDSNGLKDRSMKATVDGKVVAESNDMVERDGYQYFPPGAVHMEWLEKVPKTAKDSRMPARRPVLRRGGRWQTSRPRRLGLRVAAPEDGGCRRPRRLLAGRRGRLSVARAHRGDHGRR